MKLDIYSLKIIVLRVFLMLSHHLSNMLQKCCPIMFLIRTQNVGHHMQPYNGNFILFQIYKHVKISSFGNSVPFPQVVTFFLRGTFSVKCGIYVHQTTIYRGKGVLNNCPTYFLSPYYYLIIYIYINHPILIIIHCFKLLHTLYYNYIY